MSQIISAFLPQFFLLLSALLVSAALALAVLSPRHEITSNSPHLKKMCRSYEHRLTERGPDASTTDMPEASKIEFSESSARLTKSSAKSTRGSDLS